MAKADVINMQGEKVGDVELNDAVWAAEVKPYLIHDVVVMQLANRRRGTASTKTRGMVRGGGKKPWRQKGTGRARAGSSTSPLWVGGGRVFGPKPKEYHMALPKKVRKAALRSAFAPDGAIAASRASSRAARAVVTLAAQKPCSGSLT